MPGPRLIVLEQEEVAEIARKQAIVSALNACGAFDIRSGSVTLHYDADGSLRRVDRADILFKV